LAQPRATLILPLALVLSACGSDDGDSNDQPGPVDTMEGCDGVVVSDAECDTSLRPFVFIHGTFGSATEVSNIAQLMGSNGYCQDRFVAIEYDSLVERDPAARLAELVDAVIADTGFDQVDLAGHSQGTGHACTYLEDPARKAKIANYINFSGVCHGHGVPTLSLSSENDLVPGGVHPTGDNVTTVTHTEEDHVAIAGSRLSFIEVYKYLYGEEPQHTTVQCGQNPVIMDGKVVTFGDNVPRANSKVEIYEIDQLADTPQERGAPVMTINADANGHVRAELKRNVLYELKVSDADGTHLGYGYPPPFKRSNYLFRMLTPSTNPTIADGTTGQVVRGPNHVGLVFRYVAGALRPDWGNSLKIDGEEVLNAVNSPRDASRVGLFAYDGNTNQQTDLGLVFELSFVGATDVYVPASPPRWMQIEWTNEENRSITMKVPNWPSSESLASINLPYP
jgi:hypothetical protein